MKTPILLASVYIVYCTASIGLAETRYVDIGSTNAVAPFTNRTEAATSIQDAVDVAITGDTILVADGAYASGGSGGVYGSNRVVVTKAVVVRSENGPSMTSIVGIGQLGANAMRCVLMDNGAILDGFTLTNGAS